MPAVTFDDLVDQAVKLNAEPRAAVGEILVRYNTDAQARLAVNRWLSLQLEREIEERGRR